MRLDIRPGHASASSAFDGATTPVLKRQRIAWMRRALQAYEGASFMFVGMGAIVFSDGAIWRFSFDSTAEGHAMRRMLKLFPHVRNLHVVESEGVES